MAKINDIISVLNSELKIDEIKDNSINGLQVEGSSIVKKIAFAVDLSQNTIEQSLEHSANMIIVHHGIYWKGNPVLIKGINKKRIKLLLEKDINVYAVHLPLDLHQKYGNNIQICKKLKLKKVQLFGEYHGVLIGYYGELSKPLSFNDFISYYSSRIAKPSHFIRSCNTVKKIGVVSGGGSSQLYECDSLGIDTFITGEQDYAVQNFALESSINVIFGGHYNTEVFGVQSLMKFVKQKFQDVKTFFIDIPSVL